MRRPICPLAAVLLASVLLTSCSGSSEPALTSTDDKARPSALAWGPCAWERDFSTTVGQDRAKAFQDSFELSCASVEVPLDHDRPQDGQKLHIALSRTRLRGAKDTKPLLVNFGGPGLAGLQNAAALALRAKGDLGQHFDIIGFDPRGVGESGPLDCGSSDIPLLDLRDPDELARAWTTWSQANQDCATKLGAKLTLYDTYQTAQDIDTIREALAARQLDYLGYSYGTFFGATYAHLHPRQVHAMVLDSPIDLTRSPLTTLEQQTQALERTFDGFFEWTKTRPKYAELANSRGFLAEAFAGPNAGQLLFVISLLLHSPAQWPTLADGLHKLMASGDATTLLGAGSPFAQAASRAVTCNDLPVGQRVDYTTVQRLAHEWSQQYPTFGMYQLNFGGSGLAVGCADWPTPAHPVAPGSIDAAGAPKPLVIGGELDPSTPLVWAGPFTKVVGGVLLTAAEPGHGHYLKGAPHNCVDQAVDAYLIDGKLPPDGQRCAD